MTKDPAPDNRPPAAARRVPAPRGLSELIPVLTRPAFRKRSPMGAQVMSDWAVIVGPRLAEETLPKKLSAGTLTIACSGPVAMELQHLGPALIERINTHAGGTIVMRLRFLQEAVAPPRPKPLPAARETPQRLPDLPAGALNDALARLRAAIRSA